MVDIIETDLPPQRMLLSLCTFSAYPVFNPVYKRDIAKFFASAKITLPDLKDSPALRLKGLTHLDISLPVSVDLGKPKIHPSAR